MTKAIENVKQLIRYAYPSQCDDKIDEGRKLAYDYLLARLDELDTEPEDKDITNSALYECLRPQVRKMAHTMERKFRLHDKERGDPFRPCSFEFLNARFEEEWIEFMDSLGDEFKFDDGCDGKKPSEVWDEAGDCCNIITMIAANYERVRKERSDGE